MAVVAMEDGRQAAVRWLGSLMRSGAPPAGKIWCEALRWISAGGYRFDLSAGASSATVPQNAHLDLTSPPACAGIATAQSAMAL